MKVEPSEPMTQNENTLPDIGQAVIDQFIPVDIKHDYELFTFNEALKVVQKEKGKEILDGDHERNLSSMEANSEPVNDVLQEMILPTNSQSVSYEDKLPDDFDIYMIDPTLNTLMCSKRDLAVNHKLGVFTELTVREILNPYKIKIFQDIKITVNSHDSVTCELCPDVIFSSKLAAVNHVKEFHYSGLETTRLQMCQVCIEVFPKNSSFSKHLDKFHSGVYEKELFKYQCHDCDKDFCNIWGFWTHYRVLHPDVENVTPFKCDTCDKGFIFLEEMLEHQNIEHEAEHEDHKCTHCPLVFKSRKNFVLHLTSHDDDLSRLHLICDHCDYVASNEVEIADHHWNTHNDKRPKIIKCEHCSEIFKKTDMIAISFHYLDEHNEEFYFRCNQCEFKCKKWEGIPQHHKFKHQNLTCHQCGKICNNKYNFKKHLFHTNKC